MDREQVLDNLIKADPELALRYFRSILDLTQRMVANQIGITVATYQAHEAGRHAPSPLVRAAYARYFDSILPEDIELSGHLAP